MKLTLFLLPGGSKFAPFDIEHIEHVEGTVADYDAFVNYIEVNNPLDQVKIALFKTNKCTQKSRVIGSAALVLCRLKLLIAIHHTSKTIFYHPTLNVNVLTLNSIKWYQNKR